MKYPIYKPYLVGNEKKYVNQCIESSWISSHGEFIDKFETAFSEYLGMKYALSCSNGTVALHLALLALDLGVGDEVILPSLTYVATANAVKYIGATPVFIDSEQQYFQIDPDKIESSITEKTRAIIVVHLYGHASQMDQICNIAKKYNLFLIEDCAEAIGSKFNNKFVGTFGDVSTFSFFGNKTITTGEGGMVLTNNKNIAESVAKYKGQGVSKTVKYFHDVVGYNYRMTNICCAIGLAQLENINEILKKKNKIAQTYKKALSGVEGIYFHEEQTGTLHTFWLVSIVLNNNIKRDNLINFLMKNEIETRPFFVPMHKLPIHKKNIHLPVAERLSLQGINLPSYPELNDEDIQKISSKIIEFIKQ
ncbi:MAG: perosamine synthetase [Gammaproteobacteria bacterium RIFCSPHIGHO2_12_FULL_36_30]|nr:MAG: perosamine synthetase [Gammaproteobacteria bacterium RIFCSPHIGHO2_12_FULL_36_30]